MSDADKCWRVIYPDGRKSELMDQDEALGLIATSREGHIKCCRYLESGRGAFWLGVIVGFILALIVFSQYRVLPRMFN